MTRLPYAGSGAELVVEADENNADALVAVASAQFTVWTAATSGSQLTDLLDSALSPITAVVSGSDGRIPLFWGPDGYTGDVWLQPATGSRWRAPVSATAAYGLISLVDVTGATDGQGIFYNSGAGKFTPADSIRVTATGVGFYGTTAATKPTVTGSRASNAALASLLTALADLGLITNSTS